MVTYCPNIIYVTPHYINVANVNYFSSTRINAINYLIPAVRHLVPAVGVSQRVCGLPLAEARTIVAEEEGVAEAVHVRLAGEERTRRARGRALPVSPKAVISTGT